MNGKLTTWIRQVAQATNGVVLVGYNAQGSGHWFATLEPEHVECEGPDAQSALSALVQSLSNKAEEQVRWAIEKQRHQSSLLNALPLIPMVEYDDA